MILSWTADRNTTVIGTGRCAGGKMDKTPNGVRNPWREALRRRRNIDERKFSVVAELQARNV